MGTPTFPPTTVSNGNPPSNSHTGMIVTIIVIILVFVLAAIGFGYYRIKKKVVTDVTDASNASKFGVFNNPVGYENDLRNVQEFQMDDITSDTLNLISKGKREKTQKLGQWAWTTLCMEA